MSTNSWGVNTSNSSNVNDTMSRVPSPSPSPLTPTNITPANPGNYTPGQPSPSGGGSSGGSGGGGRRRRDNTPSDITNPLPDLTPVQTPVSTPATPMREELSRVSLIGGMSVDPNRGVMPIASTIGGNTRFLDRPSGATFEVGATAQDNPFSPTNQVPMSAQPINPFWTARSPNASYADGGSWEADAKAAAASYVVETDSSWWQRRSQEAGQRAARVKVVDSGPEFGTGTLTEYKPTFAERYIPLPVREANAGFWNMGQDGDMDFGARSPFYQMGALGGVAVSVLPAGFAASKAPKLVQLAYRGRVLAWDAVKSAPGIRNVVSAAERLPAWGKIGAKGAAGIGEGLIYIESAKKGSQIYDSFTNKDFDRNYGLNTAQIASLRKAGYAGQNTALPGMVQKGLEFVGLPGVGRLSGKGSRGFRKGVVDELTTQGFNPAQANEIAARVQRGSVVSETGEAAAMFSVNKISEKLGRQALGWSLAQKGGQVAGKYGALSAGLFTGQRIAVAGAQEGALSYVAQQRMRNEKITAGGLLAYTGIGAVTGGVIGGTIAGSPISTNRGVRAYGRAIDITANVIDPYEKGGDTLADFSFKMTRRAGGQVPSPVYGLRPKVITPGVPTQILTTQKQTKQGSTFTDIASYLQTKAKTKSKVATFTDIESFFPTQTPTSTKTATRTGTKTTSRTTTPISTFIDVPVPIPAQIMTPTSTPTQIKTPVTVPRYFPPIPPLGSGFSGAFGGKGGKAKKGASRSVFSAFFNVKSGYNQSKYGVEQTGIVLRS